MGSERVQRFIYPVRKHRWQRNGIMVMKYGLCEAVQARLYRSGAFRCLVVRKMMGVDLPALGGQACTTTRTVTIAP